MIRRLLAFVCTALLVGLLVGCGGPESTRLVGTWRPFEVDKNYGKMPGDPTGQLIVFAEDGAWRASNGCDEFTGSYDLKDDGSFSGEEKTGSAAPCAKDGFDVAAILGRVDRVTFTQCSALFELGGHRILAASRTDCKGDSILGGGLPSE